jgi:putative endonuclease
MFYVYVLESLKNGTWYIGFTSDLRRRFQEHAQGKNRSTKRYLPWKIIYYEACLDKIDAERREMWLKSTHGRRMLKARIREYLHSKN